MTNFEKVKLITKELQFLIDEGLLNEEGCGTVLEELHSVVEILADCNDELRGAFSGELEALAKVLKRQKQEWMKIPDKGITFPKFLMLGHGITLEEFYELTEKEQEALEFSYKMDCFKVGSYTHMRSPKGVSILYTGKEE